MLNLKGTESYDRSLCTLIPLLFRYSISVVLDTFKRRANKALRCTVRQQFLDLFALLIELADPKAARRILLYMPALLLLRAVPEQAIEM